MKVSQLDELVAADTTKFRRLSVGEMSVDGRVLHTPERDFSFEEDDDGLVALGRFFKIPGQFLLRLGDALVGEVFSHFFNVHSDAPAVLEYDRNHLLSVYHSTSGLIPKARFAEVVQECMKPEAEMANVRLSRGVFQVDVVTDVFSIEPREGDLTRGGLRFIGHVSPSERAPSVRTYLERLVCMNGMVVVEDDGIVSIKGNTVDEVLEEMERAANRVLSGVDQRLCQWGNLGKVQVDSVEQAIHRLATEHKLSAKVEGRILDRAPEIEGETLYDVINLITGVWSAEGVRSRQVERLQELAGAVISSTEDHRCPRCAQLL
jgi:hypothetical protein